MLEMTDEGRARWIRWSRRLRFVPRWAVMPTITKQNVAEHSYHVAQTCRWLIPRHENFRSHTFALEVIELALDHDLDEALSGDIPAPYKKTKEWDSASEAVKLVGLADVMEAMAFLNEERYMGNKTTEPVLHDLARKYVKRHRAIRWRTNGEGEIETWLAYRAQIRTDLHPALEDTE